MISLNSSVISPTSWSQPYHRAQLQHRESFPSLGVPPGEEGATGKILHAHVQVNKYQYTKIFFFFSAGIIQASVQPKKAQNRTDRRVSYKLCPSVSQNPALVLTVKSSDATTPLLSGVESSRPSKTSISAARVLKQKNTTQRSSCSNSNCAIPCKCLSLSIFKKQLGRWQKQKKGPISKIDHVQPPKHD